MLSRLASRLVPLGVALLAACGATGSRGLPCSPTIACPTGYSCSPLTSTCQPTDAAVTRADMPVSRKDTLPPPPGREAMATVDSSGSCPSPSATDLYVDASVPSSAMQTGASACPFATISAALKVAGFPSTPVTIHVAGGTYSNPSNGESFPLVVPAAVTIDGTPPSGGCARAALIDGAGTFNAGSVTGTATFILHGALNCLSIQPSSTRPDAIVLVPSAPAASITLTTVTGGFNGVWVHGNDATAVTLDMQDDVSQAANDGVLVDAASGTVPRVTIRDTDLHENGRDGVEVTVGVVTIGPGKSPVCPTSIPSGASRLYCNGQFGLQAALSSSTTSVVAEQDQWNHNPPTSGGGSADVSSLLLDAACSLPPAPGACP